MLRWYNIHLSLPNLLDYQYFNGLLLLLTNFSNSCTIKEGSMRNDMKQLKCFSIIGMIFVLITGSLAHFLYEWSGNNTIVGLFTPINESIWEHMKLLFFPMLLYAIFMNFHFRQNYPCITVSLYSGIITGTLLIPVFYYAYTYLLSKDSFVLDITIFILSIIIAFCSSYKLTLTCKLQNYCWLLCVLVWLLFVCFIIFSYYPPDLKIFKDPTIP